MIGDTICVVVAETEEILEKAKKLVKVDYEKLEPIRNVHEAMAEDAPQIHSSGTYASSVTLQEEMPKLL